MAKEKRKWQHLVSCSMAVACLLALLLSMGCGASPALAEVRDADDTASIDSPPLTPRTLERLRLNGSQVSEISRIKYEIKKSRDPKENCESFLDKTCALLAKECPGSQTNDQRDLFAQQLREALRSRKSTDPNGLIAFLDTCSRVLPPTSPPNDTTTSAADDEQDQLFGDSIATDLLATAHRGAINDYGEQVNRLQSELQDQTEQLRAYEERTKQLEHELDAVNEKWAREVSNFEDQLQVKHAETEHRLGELQRLNDASELRTKEAEGQRDEYAKLLKATLTHLATVLSAAKSLDGSSERRQRCDLVIKGLCSLVGCENDDYDRAEAINEQINEPGQQHADRLSSGLDIELMEHLDFCAQGIRGAARAHDNKAPMVNDGLESDRARADEASMGAAEVAREIAADPDNDSDKAQSGLVDQLRAQIKSLEHDAEQARQQHWHVQEVCEKLEPMLKSTAEAWRSDDCDEKINKLGPQSEQDDWLQVAKGLVSKWKSRAQDAIDKVEQMNVMLRESNERLDQCTADRSELLRGSGQDDE